MMVQVRVFLEGLGAHYADRGEEGAVGGADGVCGERDRRAENLAEKMGGAVYPRRLAHISMHYTKNAYLRGITCVPVCSVPHFRRFFPLCRYAHDAARHAGMEDEKAAAVVSGI